MVAVRVMEMAVDDVIHMIAMWDRLMTATRSMHVTVGIDDVFDAGAAAGVFGRHREHMLVHRSVLVLVMEVAVVKVVDMVAMLDRRVSTAGAVLMLVVFLAEVCRFHGHSP